MHPAIKILGKSVLESLDPLARLKYRLVSGFKQPIPPMRFRARTASRWIGRFVESARNCGVALESALRAATGSMIYDFTSVLDFGCGCGRTMLHWELEKFKLLTGCDVDEAAIAWMKQAYTNRPNMAFESTRFDPPLPFAAGQFDLIYSVSIFSHLSGEDVVLWLAELARVTRPGGIALITVQGPHAVQRFHSLWSDWHSTWAGHDLEKEGIIFIASAPSKGAEPAPGIESQTRKIEYGLTFMSHRYIEQNWANAQWEVLRIDEGTVDDLQDVVVLRRR